MTTNGHLAAPPVPTSIIDNVPLNDAQRAAVVYDGGPQLVFAGAGSGKTRVLTAKIAWLIGHKRITPHNIFAATFTNKAAQEMKQRVRALTGSPCDSLWIGTFHSLCARILRREASRLGFLPSFTIYDADDQVSAMKKVIKEMEIDERAIPPRQALGAISKYKNACTPPEDLDPAAAPFFQREIIRIYREYARMLKRVQAMDFDDLLCNAVYLFRKNPPVLASYQDLFRYVLVDEYQDTNLAQFYLVKHLAGRSNAIFVVGDDDQSIYGWRGANIENILSFEKAFPGTHTFTLEQNYRSTQAVLRFANTVIAGNTRRAEKKLWTSRSGSARVRVTRYMDGRQEADCIGDDIRELVRGGMPAPLVCVLFRTNAQSRAFEEAFRRKQLPYVLIGAVGFYERKEIKDCLAYLRLIVNPLDDLSFERIANVPPRGLGDRAFKDLRTAARAAGCSLLQIILKGDFSMVADRARKGCADLRELFTEVNSWNAAGTAPHEVLSGMLTRTGYMDMLQGDDSEESEGRLENINELMNTLTIWSGANEGKALSDFLQEVSLETDVDRWQKRDDAVNLMTMHCAKGLEFKAVFLAGLEDGILPSRLNFDDEEKMAEERRLLYVGVTRAMDVLRCSYAEQRWRFGSVTPMSPSRFLHDVPPEVFDFEDRAAFHPAREPAHHTRRNAVAAGPSKSWRGQDDHPKYDAPDHFTQETVAFRIGQYITHKNYGRGRIVSLSGFGKDLQLTIVFNDGARRKLMAAFANLENS
jgi:DNA helicase-2/ATP-dependent DNA helicase PcrA